jgi:hypothetical protein
MRISDCGLRIGARIRVAVVVCSLLVVATAAAGPTGTTRVLFIGNSLTATNDLPGRVRELAQMTGDTWETSAVVYPNYSLEDHWQRGDASRAIARGSWTFVVLQQGPSALPESRVLLIEYTRRFDTQIRAAGARTAIYMVWPADNRRGDFPGVGQSYSAAAAAVGATLLPVGDAWQAAWREDVRLPLYSEDRFHPSPLATALAAIVIYSNLGGRTVKQLPAGWSVNREQQVAILNAAARVRMR